MTPPREAPHSQDAERFVLGALILDNRQLNAASDLTTEDFYTHANRTLFGAITGMIRAKQYCDCLTLIARLRDDALLDDAGGIEYVHGVSEDGYTATGLRSYVELIRERAARRALIAACTDATMAAYGGSDSSVVLQQLQKALARASVHRSGGPVRFGEAVQMAVAEYDRAQVERRHGRTAGLAFGVPELDRVTGGARPGELVGIAARTSVGKTTLAFQCALLAALRGSPGVFYSLEENVVTQAMRGMCNAGNLDLTKLRNGDEDLAQGLAMLLGDQNFMGAPLLLETKLFDLGAITASLGRLMRQDGVKFAVVDHLTRVNVSARSGQKRYELVGDVSRGLKQTAEELQIPIIALIQIGRDVEKDQRRPRLADLRESGNIEEDLNICIAMHQKGAAIDGVVPMELGLLKNRFGPRGWLKRVYHFRGAQQRVEELDYDHETEKAPTGNARQRHGRDYTEPAGADA